MGVGKTCTAITIAESLKTITKNASSAALNQISTATSGSSSVSGLLSGGALIGALGRYAWLEYKKPGEKKLTQFYKNR